MDTISDEKDVRTVEFENIKSRGKVTKRATYQYSTTGGLEYPDLLASVAPIDDSKAVALRQAADRLNLHDFPLIQAITDCINGGIIAKTKIAKRAASVTGDSHRRALRVLEKHCGDDPNVHYWKFTIGPRGVNLFELHPTPDEVEDIVELQD